MTWTPSLTGGGGDEELVVTQEGDITEPPSWTRSQFLDGGSNPKLHGTYASDGFRLSDPGAGEPARTGTYSMRVNGLTQYAGAQQARQEQTEQTTFHDTESTHGPGGRPENFR